MKITLTSHEAQIIVDELRNSVSARQFSQSEYAAKIEAIAKKILKASQTQNPKHQSRYR